MARKRLLVTLAALGIGFVVADRLVGGWLVRSGRYAGRPLPPFDPLERPAVRELLARERERGTPGVVCAFDPELGWTNLPGAAERDGHKVTIGLRGTRGPRDYAREPPAGVRRVLCFGDSFTYGSEVADADCWPALLESSLPDTQALNFGVGAYGVDQSLLRFRREGRELRADVVLIGMMLHGAGRNVNRFHARYFPPAETMMVKPRFVFRRGQLELLPQPYATRAEFLDALEAGTALGELAEGEYWKGDAPLIPGSTLCRWLAADAAYERRSTERQLTQVRREPFVVTLELLRLFHAEALACGASRAVVLLFPGRGDLEYVRVVGKRYWLALPIELERAGVPVLDMADAFLGAGRPLDELFLEVHPSPAGNALVAASVAAWLDGGR
jgi:hypothetical protein